MDMQKIIVKFINLRGQELDPNALPASGIYIEVYSDGTMKKVYR
jgi:hypothetical protein